MSVKTTGSATIVSCDRSFVLSHPALPSVQMLFGPLKAGSDEKL